MNLLPLTIFAFILLSGCLSQETRFLIVDTDFVVTAGFLTAFTDSDLNADGILVISHDANRQYPTVTVFDFNQLILLPDDVLFVDGDTIDINLLSQRPLVGTWHLRVETNEIIDANAFIRLDGTNDENISAQIQFPFGILLPNTQSVVFRDSDINISSTFDSVLNISADANVLIDANAIINGSLKINGVNGGCLKIEDTDTDGFTFCTTLNGVLTCSTTPC